MKVIWSPTAVGDLVQIRQYIAANNPTAASKVGDAILAAIGNLRRYPDIGRVPDTRELLVPETPFLIPYTVTPRGIEIIAVLHGAQL